MPIWTNAASDLLIQHPAIPIEWAKANLAYPDVEYSAELARFLNRTGLGYQPTRSESDIRCMTIVTRKSAYGSVLVSELGYLTPTGQEIYSDIKRMYQQLTLHMQETGEKLPNPTDSIILDETDQMDRLILKGTLTPRSLKYLRVLAALANPQIIGTPVVLDEFAEDIKDYQNGEKVLATGFLRTRPYERLALEKLIKFGFADLIKLPKPEEKRNRGRHPVAVKVTPIGAKFYALWVQKFDPLIQQERSWQQEFTDQLDQNTITRPPRLNQDQ